MRGRTYWVILTNQLFALSVLTFLILYYYLYYHFYLLILLLLLLFLSFELDFAVNFLVFMMPHKLALSAICKRIVEYIVNGPFPMDHDRFPPQASQVSTSELYWPLVHFYWT